MNVYHLRILKLIYDTPTRPYPPEKVYIGSWSDSTVIYVLAVYGSRWVEYIYSRYLNTIGGAEEISQHMAMHELDMSPDAYHVYTLED
jgi:hypothetical protein